MKTLLFALLERDKAVTFWRKRNKEIDFILPKKKIGRDYPLTPNLFESKLKKWGK